MADLHRALGTAEKHLRAAINAQAVADQYATGAHEAAATGNPAAADGLRRQAGQAAADAMLAARAACTALAGI